MHEITSKLLFRTTYSKTTFFFFSLILRGGDSFRRLNITSVFHCEPQAAVPHNEFSDGPVKKVVSNPLLFTVGSLAG